MRKLRIALAKGALQEGALEFLSKKGIEIHYDDAKNKRKLIKNAQYNDIIINNNELKEIFKSCQIEFLNVRGHDVPVYVENGAADLGIVGLDVILDSKVNIKQLKDLNYGNCTLCVCALKGSYKSLEEIPNYSRIVTSFPNITKDFFQNKGIDVEVLKLYGSVELGPLTNLSDLIVDLVATGKTLEENGLEVVSKIVHCTSRLIANPVSYKFHRRACEYLMS